MSQRFMDDPAYSKLRAAVRSLNLEIETEIERYHQQRTDSITSHPAQAARSSFEQKEISTPLKPPVSYGSTTAKEPVFSLVYQSSEADQTLAEASPCPPTPPSPYPSSPVQKRQLRKPGTELLTPLGIGAMAIVLIASAILGVALQVNDLNLRRANEQNPLTTSTPTTAPSSTVELANESPTLPQTQKSAGESSGRRFEQAQPSPEKGVENYYLAINQGIKEQNLSQAWSLMSPTFQYQDARNSQDQFSQWWITAVQEVKVDAITPRNNSSETPEVEALVRYLRNNGGICTDRLLYTLVWNTEKSMWILDSRKRLEKINWSEPICRGNA